MANDNIKSSKQKRFILRTWHIAVTFIIVAIVAIISASAYFVWDRWDRYDDAQEIQGQWYVFGTKVPIKITENMLDFSADTSYHYELDPVNKTITFKLGNMEGMAHYCFFEDRQVLLLLDGKDFTRWGAAGEDLIISLQEFVSLSSGRIPQYPQGDGIIILARTPDKHGWGDYSYAYKKTDAEPEPASKPKDESSNAEPDEASRTSDDAPDASDDQSTDPVEGTPREDDPFGFVSDTLADVPQTPDDADDRENS